MSYFKKTIQRNILTIVIKEKKFAFEFYLNV